jgi:hypothetical protein
MMSNEKWLDRYNLIKESIRREYIEKKYDLKSFNNNYSKNNPLNSINIKEKRQLAINNNLNLPNDFYDFLKLSNGLYLEDTADDFGLISGEMVIFSFNDNMNIIEEQKEKMYVEGIDGSIQYIYLGFGADSLDIYRYDLLNNKYEVADNAYFYDEPYFKSDTINKMLEYLFFYHKNNI